MVSMLPWVTMVLFCSMSIFVYVLFFVLKDSVFNITLRKSTDSLSCFGNKVSRLVFHIDKWRQIQMIY